MPQQPPGAVVLAVSRMASQVRGAVERQVLEPAGLSLTAFAVLAVVADADAAVRLHAVAAAAGMAHGTARSAVARLEHLGLLSRSTPGRDRRQVELSVSRSGRALAERLRAAAAAVEAQLVPDPRVRHLLVVAAGRFRLQPLRRPGAAA
ncbi:MarR family transcriptional regulator [Dactylosporangium sp. NPDC000244]|uniref:MarR family transcriptional regulator n=1 Tax=Dactylosporangium sp. NPDC000244 TaxID=3154365 RepID=UPI0033295F37